MGFGLRLRGLLKVYGLRVESEGFAQDPSLRRLLKIHAFRVEAEGFVEGLWVSC